MKNVNLKNCILVFGIIVGLSQIKELRQFCKEMEASNKEQKAYNQRHSGDVAAAQKDADKESIQMLKQLKEFQDQEKKQDSIRKSYQ